VGYASPPAFGSDPLAPARRASLLMFVLSALVLLCSGCVGLMAVVPLEQMAAQQGQQLPPLPPGIPSWKAAQAACGVFAIIFLGAGIAELFTAVLIRRGGKGASIFGIVLAAPFILFFGINAISAASMGQGCGAAALCLLMVASFGFQIALCIQVLRSSSQLQLAQMAYQAQYWQYLQQQQAYNTSAGAASGYSQGLYNAPPAGAPQQPAANQTGWQWTAPPPPPTAPTPPPSQPDNVGEPHGPQQ
jgi:hypothetical protein